MATPVRKMTPDEIAKEIVEAWRSNPGIAGEPDLRGRIEKAIERERNEFKSLMAMNYDATRARITELKDDLYMEISARAVAEARLAELKADILTEKERHSNAVAYIHDCEARLKAAEAKLPTYVTEHDILRLAGDDATGADGSFDPTKYNAYLRGFRKAMELGAQFELKKRWPNEVEFLSWFQDTRARASESNALAEVYVKLHNKLFGKNDE